MALSKKTFPKAAGAAAAFDPLQNFETVTYTGNGGTQKITGYIRKGAAFNGTSSEIDLGNVINFGSSNYTISFWFNASVVGSGRAFFGTYNGSGLLINIESNNKLRFYHSGGTAIDIQTLSTLSTDTWYHVACVMNHNSIAELYLNGASQGTATGSGLGTASGGDAIIGNYPSGSYYFSGKIDQLRIFNKAISSSEVTTLYGETYASSTKSTTDIFGDGSGVALYELDENAQSSNFLQGGSFNGTGAYMTASQSMISTPSSPYSFSLWFKKDSTNYKGMFMNMSSTQRVGEIGVTFTNATTITIYTINTAGSNQCDGVSATVPTMSTGVWYHLVVIADVSSSDRGKIYINGTEASSYTFLTSTANIGGTAGYTYIGTADAQYFDGDIDQVRIYDASLTTSDITKLYNESSQIPTTNLVAHYKLDGDATDETGNYDATDGGVTYVDGVYAGTATNVNFLGMAFQPDLVWIKDRAAAENHYLIDSVRGLNGGSVFETLYTNLTNGEANDIAVTSLDSNGFTLGSGANGNVNGESNVAWCWKAGGAAVSGTGTSGITNVEVSANTAAGFSIVKYNGGGTAGGTVTHGLDSAPELIIVKRTDTSGDWIVGSDYLTSWGHILQLNLSDAEASYAGFNSTSPSSSVFTLGSNNPVNNSSGSYIALCFHSVDGYQRIGTYTGASGLRVYTDSNGDGTGTGAFQPRFLMVKKTTSANWVIIDSVRVNGIYEDILFPNTNDAEAAGNYDELTFNSDGFTWNQTENTKNAIGGEYIYLAIA